jgi:serine protein kinase
MDYLELCSKDPSAYASPHERMLKAIGEPEFVDTHSDERLSRIFGNRIIKRYPAFKDFYGIETVIESLVSYFKHAAQGLEEHKQILYLLGPVGSSKSSIAEKLKELMETQPVYVLEGSPVFENPLGLFDKEKYGDTLFKEYGIPKTALRTRPSPWAIEKLKEFGGDITQFRVQKVYPSRLTQTCISRIEPADENNQDVSSMVGKVDIRKLEDYEQNHPYAYSYSGGLCRGNNGVVEMVEMFKAPLKTLNPLLTATQDKMYIGTESISAIPFDGIILAHSNESEWQSFKNNKTNEAFIDRVYIVRVPYCLRVTEEAQIYEKLLANSNLSKAACAPGTLDILSKFCVMTRLVAPENSTLYSKMQIYDGVSLKDSDPHARSLQEYRDAAGVDEGMAGVSTRFAFKILSKTFNYDTEEIAANPVHLLYILENEVIKEQYNKERQESYIGLIKGVLTDKYFDFVEKDIRKAFMESFGDMCQNVFETYFHYVNAWVQDQDYRDPATGVMLDRSDLNAELEKIEKPAGIINPKEWRSELVNFVLRKQVDNKGEMPRWDVYERMKDIVEKKVLASTDEILPVISFGPKKSEKEKREHDDFIASMKKRGYTARQCRLLVEWWMRYRKAH